MTSEVAILLSVPARTLLLRLRAHPDIRQNLFANLNETEVHNTVQEALCALLSGDPEGYVRANMNGDFYTRLREACLRNNVKTHEIMACLSCFRACAQEATYVREPELVQRLCKNIIAMHTALHYTTPVSLPIPNTRKLRPTYSMSCLDLKPCKSYHEERKQYGSPT